VARAEPDLPVLVNQDPDKLSLESVLDHRMISLRNPKILSIFRVQAAILKHFAEHLRGEGFTEIKTSKLIGTGTEGGTGLFSVDYFDTKVFLAQSPQFYKQAMVASGLERVFEIGCVYRAEKHETPRHLNEYVSLDVELAWIESEQDLMDLEVRILCDWAAKEHGVEAIFVYGFPRKKCAFCTYPVDSRVTMGFDCLFRGLEITTGSRRIHEYRMLLDSVESFGLKPEGLSDYLSIFKYGRPPHGDFAIGLERLTQKVLGLSNVKEACLFPRDRKRVRP
jgi:nondiscriminating aspartyl-tRNA synthetase